MTKICKGGAMREYPHKQSLERREFLKTSAKLGIGASLVSLSGFALSACDSKTSNTQTQHIQGDTMKTNLTPKAKQTFEKLFGSTDVPLSKSDPEFFSNYVNFAFDEVPTESKLELKEGLMITLASLVAIPALSEFKAILNAALKNGVEPVAIKEILYQATPYVGMGKVLDFINATNEIFTQQGIALPLESQGRVEYAQRREKGLETQRALFGEAIDKGNAAAPKDYQHIRTFLSANCFGDYYTRGGLPLKFRELLTLVYILSMGGADSQVRAHIAGNIRVGNDRGKLISVITALVPYIGYPRSLNALSALDEIAPLH